MWEGKRKDIWTRISALYLLFSVICLGVAMALDWSSEDYCCPAVEEFFTSQDRSPYISTSLVIWTFGTSLLVYFMGKMGDRCFGIRYYEVLLAQKRKWYWVGNLVIFFVEIVLLEIVASCSLPITLFAISMLQLLNIVFILLVVIHGTSQGNVVDAIKVQNQQILQELADREKEMQAGSGTGLRELEALIDGKKRDWLLFKAMRDLNYNSYEDIECLKDSLLPQAADLDNVSGPMQLMMFWKLGSLMMGNGTTREGVPAAMNLFLVGVAHNADYSTQVKKGLLAALVISGDTWDCQDRFQYMLEQIDAPQRGPMIDWSYWLMKAVTDDWTHAWKTRLLDLLEACGSDYGCQVGHVLEPEENLELTAFIDYLTHEDKAGPGRIGAGQMAGAAKGGVADNV